MTRSTYIIVLVVMMNIVIITGLIKDWLLLSCALLESPLHYGLLIIF